MPEPHCPSTSGRCPAAPREPAHGLPWKIAGPSFIVPGRVGKNCSLLQGLVDEAAVLLFETKACLDYDERDLPSSLADLDLGFHLHLPLDTNWDAGLDTGLDRAWEPLAALLDKTAFLAPTAYVLHPPPDELLAPLAARFRDRGIDPGRVLLENVSGHDLLGAWDLAAELGYGVCLDLGHVQAYSQHSLLEARGLWDRVGMLHAYAPGQNGLHRSLDELDPQGRDLLRHTLTRLDERATLTLEIFDLDGLTRSLELVAAWWEQWRT